jgi:ribonucleoside-diphosphate reductase alpha chain
MLPFINTALPKGANENLSSRFGVPVEKNVPLNEPILEKCNKRLMEKLNFWSVYPDLWAEEVLLPVNSSFHWMFYQRIILRQLARVPLNHITAARGVSKTFLEVFASVHRCIFCPTSSIAITAPSKTQAAQVAKQTFNDILARFPYLQNELTGPPLAGKDYFVINFKNGSKIEVTAALETTRGRRFDAIAVDETRDQQGDAVNSILVPTTSKVRLTVGAGQLNPYEMHQIQTYTTSASSKSNYNYEKALDILVRMIIDPKSAWIMGLDYRVPVIEGIYPASFVRDMRSDKTMNEQIFAREYLSTYTSENDEAWFNFNKLNNHRKIINAEWRAHFNKNNKDIFYLISVNKTAA